MPRNKYYRNAKTEINYVKTLQRKITLQQIKNYALFIEPSDDVLEISKIDIS